MEENEIKKKLTSTDITNTALIALIMYVYVKYYSIYLDHYGKNIELFNQDEKLIYECCVLGLSYIMKHKMLVNSNGNDNSDNINGDDDIEINIEI